MILERRSIRLFKEEKVPLFLIKKVIDAGRLAPSAGNLQFLEYLVIDTPQGKGEIFQTLRWAMYVHPKRTPPAGQRPSFYIIVLINLERTREPNLRDIGAAVENILLSLVSFGLGGCWLQNIDREALYKILKLPSRYQIDSVVAAGYPLEKPKLETSHKRFKYWVDKNNCLHVPKRPLKDIFHYQKIE